MPDCPNISLEDIEYKNTHLVAHERVDVAMDFLVHEFSKIFPSFKREKLKKDLARLRPNNTSTDVEIRDFWNLCNYWDWL